MTLEEILIKSKKMHQLKESNILLTDLNTLDTSFLDELESALHPNELFRPVVFLRYLILQKVKNKETITKEIIDELKSAIENRNVTKYYNTSLELQKSLENYKEAGKGMFPQWKEPFPILYPFFYSYQEKLETTNELERLGNEIISRYSIQDAKVHTVGFEGAQNYGSDMAWLAIIPRVSSNVQRSYQLFFGITHNGINGGLYKGHKVENDSFLRISKTYQTWNDFLSDIGNLIPEWEKLNSTIDFHFQNDERDFKNRIEKSDREEVTAYFKYIDNIIEDLSILNEDNLVFSTSRSQLSFQIGNRYCFNLKKDTYSFISPTNLIIEGIEKEVFSGTDNALFYKETNRSVVADNIKEIKEAIQFELERDKSSNPKEYDNSAFRMAVFDKAYRNKFINLMNNKTMISKEIIDEAIKVCNSIHTGNVNKTISMANYNETVKPLLDEFKSKYGGSPNTLFNAELDLISKENKIGGQVKSENFTVRGRQNIHSYFWSTLFPATISYRDSIQLYILVSEVGIKFGLGYGVNTDINTPGVKFLKENSAVAEKLFSLISNDEIIKFYNSEPGGDSLPRENESIQLSSTLDLQSQWSSRSDVLGIFRVNNIPTNAGEIIHKSLTKLLNVFLEVANLNLNNSLIANESEIKYDKSNYMENKTQLNQIFFGPPGTGKTFHTINEAVKIINPDFYNQYKFDRDKLREEFNRHLIIDWEFSQGQIGFCTFHQSFSYEDFVEGIKPIEPKDGDEYLKYKVQEGIFKKISRFAEDNIKSLSRPSGNLISLSDSEYENAVFYKISLGDINDPSDQEIYDYCMEKGFISLGFGGAVDFSGKDECGVTELYRAKIKEGYGATALNLFKNYLKVGNYVVVSKGNHYIRALGKVTGEYFYDPNTPIRHKQFRKVEWIFKDQDIPIQDLYEKNLSQQSIYKLKSNFVKKEFFVNTKVVDNSKFKKAKNYVLIIDEINRGNVASIFGELITLIEKDKRAENNEALEIVLPYSKDRFTVPPNLYIIGTMNTADKSIEALDTALRRRFSFREMPPVSSLIKTEGKLNQTGGKIGTIDVVALLDKVNDRIEKLIDKDHKIGHSYFMTISSLEELKDVFRDKVIPLLEEYFFGDFGKIGLILGDSFIEKIETTDFGFAEFVGYDNQVTQDLADRPIYKIKDQKEWDFDSIYNVKKAN
jgi:5-methylcytosine-specific restriction endonuclease McrBC GTP-binding regulatory subunit McrB